MEYLIPNNKVEKLQKIISKYQKKTTAITFTMGEEVVADGTLTILDSRSHKYYTNPIKVKCTKVFVDGSYKINGWSFAGTIEFTENGNIIRLANSSFEGKVPEKYRHTDKICEHCGKIRNRKDTYLIYNEEKDEFKQVGSGCLLDYTQGLNADECAKIMSCLDTFEEISNMDFGYDEFKSYDNTDFGLPRESVLPIVYAYVKKNGYTKGETANAIDEIVFGTSKEAKAKRDSLELPTEEEIKAVDNYALAHYQDYYSDYMCNASLSWLNSFIEYRHFGFVSSFVNTYFKEVMKIETRKRDLDSKNNEFVGNVGDRIIIKVAKARVLYTKNNSHKSYYACDTEVYEIIDKDGHTYKWSTTNEVKEGDEIKATIKAHSEYKGLKQTIITRGIIIDRTPKNVEKATHECERAMDSFINCLD